MHTNVCRCTYAGKGTSEKDCWCWYSLKYIKYAWQPSLYSSLKTLKQQSTLTPTDLLTTPCNTAINIFNHLTLLPSSNHSLYQHTYVADI